MTLCDDCACWFTDEEEGDEYCSMELDEDEVRLFYASGGRECPFYRPDDEYAVVRHQM